MSLVVSGKKVSQMIAYYSLYSIILEMVLGNSPALKTTLFRRTSEQQESLVHRQHMQ